MTQQIDNACTWYHRHYEEILDALPITTQGATYGERWPETFTWWVVAWQSGELPEKMAKTYVLRPLQKIRDHLCGETGKEGVEPKASVSERPRKLEITVANIPNRAVTLHRPWSYAIARLGKDIENRTWPCPLQSGEWLAIHAGKRWDSGAKTFINMIGMDVSGDNTRYPTGIVAIAKFTGNVTESDSPWFVGPVGWELAEAIEIDVVEAKGYQGIWYLSQEQKAEISRQLSEGITA